MFVLTCLAGALPPVSDPHTLHRHKRSLPITEHQQHREKAAATTASTFTPSPLLSLSPLRPPLPSLAATSPIPTAADTPVNPWHTALPADCVPPPLNSFWTHVPAASVAGGGLEVRGCVCVYAIGKEKEAVSHCGQTDNLCKCVPPKCHHA